MSDTRVSLGGIVILGVAIAMVVVGAQNLEACENDGALFLVVNGSFILGFPILASIIIQCLPQLGKVCRNHFKVGHPNLGKYHSFR